MGDISGGTVFWEGIEFPDNWTGNANGSESFTIAGIYVDATSVDDDRLEAVIDMTANTLATDQVLDASNDVVTVARVDQALDLSFAAGPKGRQVQCLRAGFRGDLGDPRRGLSDGVGHQ